MPHGQGQKPIVGSAVCDKNRCFGIVTHIIRDGSRIVKLALNERMG